MNIRKALLLTASLAVAMFFQTACKDSKTIGSNEEAEEEETKYPVYESSEVPNPYSWIAVDGEGIPM